jgi:4-amino-4-deoxy-L-arabinose transferase-like glycosyltransferase
VFSGAREFDRVPLKRAALSRYKVPLGIFAVLWLVAIGIGVFDFKNAEARAAVQAVLPYLEDVFTHVPRNIVAFPQALLLLFSGFGAGDLICSAFRLTFRSREARLAAALSFGLMCWTFAVMIVGTVQHLSSPVLGSLLAIGLVFSVVRLYTTRPAWLTPSAVTTPARWSRILTIAILAILAGTMYFALLGTLQPEVEFDARLYHLAAAKHYAEHGGLYNMAISEGQPYFGFPQYQEFLYTAAYQLFGMYGAKAMSWAGLLVAVIAIVGFGVEFFGSALIGLLGALLFASTPIVTWSATTANTDLAQVPFFVLALYGVLRWKEDVSSRKWLLFAGLLCGFAFGIKSFSLLSFVVLGGFVAAIALQDVLVSGKSRPATMAALAALAAFAAGAFVTALPSFIRSALVTGDPIFPVGATLLHSPLWSAKADLVQGASFQAYGANTSWVVLPLLPWVFTMHVEQYRDVIGPLFLFALPFVVIYAFRKDAHPLIRPFVAFLGLWSVLWVASGAVEARYALPLFPMFTLMAAYLALAPGAPLLGAAVQKLFLALLIVVTIFNAQPLLPLQRSALLPYAMGLVGYQWDYIYGCLVEDSVQLQYVPMVAWMNAHLDPKKDRVYTKTIDDQFNLYSDIELYEANDPVQQVLNTWTLESPGAYDRLKSLGINYVLIDGTEESKVKASPIFARLKEVGSSGSPNGVSTDILYRLE